MPRLSMTVIALALASIASAAPLAGQAASQDSLKRQAIRRLLVLQRTDSMMLFGMAEGLPADAPSDPNLPAGFREALLERARNDIGQFLEMMVPVYDSLYTLDDIRQLIGFHESPAGRKMIATQPRLMQALGELGRQWGMELAGKVLVDLSRRPARP